MLNRSDASVVGLSDPAFDGFAVTPADGADLGQVTRALWIGTGGSLVVVMAGGTTLTLANIPSGNMIPIQIGRAHV